MSKKGYITCGIIIIIAIFAAVMLFDTLNIKGGTYGSPFHYDNPANYLEYSKFDNNFDFVPNNEKTIYTSEAVYAAQKDFNGARTQYRLFFNNVPVSDMTQTAGRINATYTLKFKDTDGEIVASARLRVTIEYLDSGVKVTVTVRNENNAISYLDRYITINGATWKVMIRE